MWEGREVLIVSQQQGGQQEIVAEEERTGSMCDRVGVSVVLLFICVTAGDRGE